MLNYQRVYPICQTNSFVRPTFVKSFLRFFANHILPIGATSRAMLSQLCPGAGRVSMSMMLPLANFKCIIPKETDYPLVIKRGNGKSLINGEPHGKSTIISIATFDYRRVTLSLTPQHVFFLEHPSGQPVTPDFYLSRFEPCSLVKSPFVVNIATMVGQLFNCLQKMLCSAQFLAVSVFFRISNQSHGATSPVVPQPRTPHFRLSQEPLELALNRESA